MFLLFTVEMCILYFYFFHCFVRNGMVNFLGFNSFNYSFGL